MKTLSKTLLASAMVAAGILVLTQLTQLSGH